MQNVIHLTVLIIFLLLLTNYMRGESSKIRTGRRIDRGAEENRFWKLEMDWKNGVSWAHLQAPLLQQQENVALQARRERRVARVSGPRGPSSARRHSGSARRTRERSCGCRRACRCRRGTAAVAGTCSTQHTTHTPLFNRFLYGLNRE